MSLLFHTKPENHQVGKDFRVTGSTGYVVDIIGQTIEYLLPDQLTLRGSL